MNINQAQQIPLAAILSRLGHTPVKTYKGGVELAYYSPFRKETTPSFFVNVVKNVWNDFGDSGGTVLDFVMRYHNTNLPGALNYLAHSFGNDFFAHKAQNFTPSVYEPSKAETLVITDIKTFGTTPAVTNYIVNERKINSSIAHQYLKEVYFINKDNDKPYFAAAFANAAGGFELRNAYFKGSINGKDMSFFKGQKSDSIAVFEGFMDFLSFLTFQKWRVPKCDILVLNSVAFKEKAANFIHQKAYPSAEMWLNNDKAGKETLHFLIENTDCAIIPQNHLYLDFNDLNALLVFNSIKKTI